MSRLGRPRELGAGASGAAPLPLFDEVVPIEDRVLIAGGWAPVDCRRSFSRILGAPQPGYSRFSRTIVASIRRMRASQRLDYVEVKGDDGDFHILHDVNDADAWETVDFSPEGHMTCSAIAMACVLTMPPLQAEAQQPARVTILYDAFGPASALQKDWGFAALIEYGGRRILFDTGNDAGIFARNVEQLGVDLMRLDAAVISHRHGDHTTGLEVLIAANPTVRVYAPQEGAFFRGGVPSEFLTRDASVPANMRYFDGKDPDPLRSGTPWPRGNFQIVTRTTEILPGFFVLTTRSDKPGTREMNELSLAVRTPQGLAVVVGCSHPGIEKILDAAAQIDKQLYTSIGGFHLVQTPREEIERVAGMLHDTLKLQRVAPGHCTSEPGFAAFMRKFGDRFDQAGIGATLQLPRWFGPNGFSIGSSRHVSSSK